MGAPIAWIADRERLWDDFAREHLPPGASLVSISKANSDRRCFRAGDQLLKVVRGIAAPAPVSALEREAQILNRLGRKATVETRESSHIWAVLNTEWIDGEPLEGLPRDAVRPFGIAREVWRVNRRGVMHRDLNLGNMVMTAGGELALIDFGAAELVPARLAVAGDFLGLPRGTYRGNSLRHTLAVLWPAAATARRRVRAIARGQPRDPSPTFRRIDHLDEPHVPADDPQSLRGLADAWQDRSAHMPYGLSVGSLVLRAPASWLPVWRALMTRTDFEGRHILDVGTNGLLGIFALHEGAASATTLVLGDTVEPDPARLDRAFGVDPDRHCYANELPSGAHVDLAIGVGSAGVAAIEQLSPTLTGVETILMVGSTPA